MIQLCYDAYSIAYFAVSYEMGSRTMMDFLEDLFVREQSFLHPSYKGNKKRFLSDVLYWTDYLIDQEQLNREFPVIEKDFEASGMQFDWGHYTAEYRGIDLYFMIMRLRILYLGTQEYVRIKLRTLLKHYGYRRRSQAIVAHMQTCLDFYHIQPHLKGGRRCDISEIKLDDMITFRLN